MPVVSKFNFNSSPADPAFSDQVQEFRFIAGEFLRAIINEGAKELNLDAKSFIESCLEINGPDALHLLDVVERAEYEKLVGMNASLLRDLLYDYGFDYSDVIEFPGIEDERDFYVEWGKEARKRGARPVAAGDGHIINMDDPYTEQTATRNFIVGRLVKECVV